jgi:hypothetical protein
MDYFVGHQFIRGVATCCIPCEKQILTQSNIVGVETAKCHTVTEKCTRQPAQTAEKNVMFLSSQTVAGQFTAASATQKEDHHEDTKRKLVHL